MNKLISNSDKIVRSKLSIKTGEEEIKKLLKEATKSNFTVNSRDITRSAMRGKDYVGVAMFGSIPYTMANSKNMYIKDQKMYKVTQPKKK